MTAPIDPLEFLREIQAEAQIAKNALRRGAAVNGYSRFDRIEKLAEDGLRHAQQDSDREGAATR